MENAKVQKFKCDILSNFWTMCMTVVQNSTPFSCLKNLTFCLQTRQRNTAPTCSCHYTCKILQNTTTHSSTNLPKNSIYSSFYVLWDFHFYWNLWQGFDYFQKVLSGNTAKRSTSSLNLSNYCNNFKNRG